MPIPSLFFTHNIIKHFFLDVVPTYSYRSTVVTPHAAVCQYKYGTIKKEKEKETSTQQEAD